MTHQSRAEDEAEASADADDAAVRQDAADDIVAKTFPLAFRQRDSYDQTRADTVSARGGTGGPSAIGVRPARWRRRTGRGSG